MRLVLFFLAALAVAGCEKKVSAPTSAGPIPAPQGGMPGGGAAVAEKLPGGPEFAAGKKLYADNNWARCHKLGETGGAPMGGPPGGMKGGPGGMGSGPELTMTGANPAHTPEWLSAHIRDPKAHSPQSRMPATGPDRLSDADLKVLAEYLAGRK